MNHNVVIICSANMCRSPMAAGYLTKKLNETGNSEIDVQSAALYYDGGMAATDGARHTAGINGFNLDNHRSQFLDDALFNWADEILVMTLSHKNDLFNRFGKRCEGKVFLLGAFEPGKEGQPEHLAEIQDPYGSAHSTYESVFQQIQRSLDNWLEQRKKKN